MPIELAADNHIGTECIPVPKRDLKSLDKKQLMWQTLAEWGDSVESGFYQDHDCDGAYACEYEGVKYIGKISCYQDDLDDGSIPAWATHVLWSSK